MVQALLHESTQSPSSARLFGEPSSNEITLRFGKPSILLRSLALSLSSALWFLKRREKALAEKVVLKRDIVGFG